MINCKPNRHMDVWVTEGYQCWSFEPHLLPITFGAIKHVAIPNNWEIPDIGIWLGAQQRSEPRTTFEYPTL